MTGEEIPEDFFGKMLAPSLTERFFASMPESRYWSTLRTLTDVRKGPGAKALNLLSGAKVTDVSPRKQEAILREYLRSMIAGAGGTVFEKATFSAADLARMGPAEKMKAMQLKALMDERAAIAKLMKKANFMGQQYG
jgi:hypothetical protein